MRPMTKKAEKEARIAANKRSAWKKRVRTLTGHMIYDRIPDKQLDTAYADGNDADKYAAELASREPVGKAVHPLKVHAVEEAGKRAKNQIESIRADLEAHNWDMNAAAPYPESNIGRLAYMSAVNKYNLYSSVTTTADASGVRRWKEPLFVKMCEEGSARFISKQEEMAAFQYDAFICKLVQKVGECLSATIAGSHVWDESVLTVQKEQYCEDNVNSIVVERWRTHQIWNRSKYDLDFPQWPSRLLKD